jgi:hypothetical protein
MSQPTPISPRQEALASILAVREGYANATIDPDTWVKLVGIAWDNRAFAGDRRELQRELRRVLLEAARTSGGASDATS